MGDRTDRLRVEWEWHPKAWDIFAGFHPYAWGFGAHVELARAEQGLWVSFGPLYLTVHR